MQPLSVGCVVQHVDEDFVHCQLNAKLILVKIQKWAPIDLWRILLPKWADKNFAGAGSMPRIKTIAVIRK